MAWFSTEELRDLIITMLAVTFIFAYRDFLVYRNFSLFGVYLVAVIIVFLFHELAHRFVANKFGCVAAFKMWLPGIVIGLLIVVATGGLFFFVAPGAVVIYPYRFERWKFAPFRAGRVTHKTVALTIREMGIIAVSGPLMNILFALVFFLLFYLFPWSFFSYVAFISAWLALFNLLPINPLDGSKVIAWKPWFWIVLIFIASLLVFAQV